jgi:hypothetical protein
MQMPSKSHLESSTMAMPSFKEIAFRGHIFTHSPEPLHLSRSTSIFIFRHLYSGLGEHNFFILINTNERVKVACLT